MNIRKSFEAWFLREYGDGNFSRIESGEYADLAVRNYWDIWQGAWAVFVEQSPTVPGCVMERSKEAQEIIRQMAERLSDIDGAFAWDSHERAALNYIEQQEARIAGLEQRPAVPEGWRIERTEDGRIIVQKDGIVGYVAAENGESGIAESALYRLAADLLSAQPAEQQPTLDVAARRQSPPDDPLGGLTYQPDGDANFYTLSRPEGRWVARIQFNGELYGPEQERILESMLGDRNVRYGDGYHDGLADAWRDQPDVAGLVEVLEGALSGHPLDTEFWSRCERFVAAHRPAPAQQPKSQKPESIREGAPYKDPSFESLCREHEIWGTAAAAQCAVFWEAGKRVAEQQPAPDVAGLVEALEGIMRVEARDRVMPVGAEWDAARAALAAYRKGGEV